MITKERSMQTSTHANPRALRDIEMALERTKAEIPVLTPMVTAFGPLLAERFRLREAASGWVGPLPVVDAERFSQGVFVLADSGFQDMSAHLSEAAHGLLPIMANSFPAMAQELNTLIAAMDNGALTMDALAAAGFGEAFTVPGVNAETMDFAVAELVRPFVERQAQDLAKLVRDLPWRQTICPICGGTPNMSVLRRIRNDSEFIQAHGGRRFLRCSCCATEWTHKRISCPSCGCEEPDELVVLSDPSRPFERADACHRCKTFLLCLDTGELADIPDPDVAALTMLPLAHQARRQGFVPLAEHPWGGL